MMRVYRCCLMLLSCSLFFQFHALCAFEPLQLENASDAKKLIERIEGFKLYLNSYTYFLNSPKLPESSSAMPSSIISWLLATGSGSSSSKASPAGNCSATSS